MGRLPGWSGHLSHLSGTGALRRCDLDLTTRTVSIRRQYVETNGSLMIAPPKSRAGIRTVAFRQRSSPSCASTSTPTPSPRTPRSYSLASAAAC